MEWSDVAWFEKMWERWQEGTDGSRQGATSTFPASTTSGITISCRCSFCGSFQSESVPIPRPLPVFKLAKLTLYRQRSLARPPQLHDLCVRSRHIARSLHR